MKYATIVADPPWPYSDTNANALRRTIKQDGTEAIGAGTDEHYSVMSLEEIASLPVQEVAEDNAHLYLWVTNSFIEEGHGIVRSWGFKPKTVLTWVKVQHHKDPARVSMKTGYYFRGATEHVLFAVRGSLRLQDRTGYPTAYLWPRLPHSVKPQEFFDLVERVSPGPYLELFARKAREGWDAWGNEAPNSVELPAADQPALANDNPAACPSCGGEEDDCNCGAAA